jgi:hypothetical protein
MKHGGSDFLHTSSWMIHRPREPQSRGRLGELVLFDRPQRIPRRGPDGLVAQVTTPTPWRRAFLWRPIRTIELLHGGTIVERWSWLRTVERRTHYGAAQPDEVVEIRVVRPSRI